MRVDVLKICGEDIISRDAGLKIRNTILAHWDQEVISIEFGGRTVASVSFFDEAVGLLLKKGGKSVDEIKKKLKFPDLKPGDRTLLNYVVSARIKEMEEQARR